MNRTVVMPAFCRVSFLLGLLGVLGMPAFAAETYHDLNTAITLEVSGSGQGEPGGDPKSAYAKFTGENLFLYINFRYLEFNIDGLTGTLSLDGDANPYGIVVETGFEYESLLTSSFTVGDDLQDAMQLIAALRSSSLIAACAETAYNAHTADAGKPYTHAVRVRAMVDAMFYAATAPQVTYNDVQEFLARWQALNADVEN